MNMEILLDIVLVELKKTIKNKKNAGDYRCFFMIVANRNSLQFMQRFVPIVPLVGLRWIAC